MKVRVLYKSGTHRLPPFEETVECKAVWNEAKWLVFDRDHMLIPRRAIAMDDIAEYEILPEGPRPWSTTTAP
jgi:hypothetical protein